MPDETTDPYRVAAEAIERWALLYPIPGFGLAEGANAERLARNWARGLAPFVLDAVRPLFDADGREAAAQAIEATLAAREAQGCTYIRIADVRQALGGDR